MREGGVLYQLSDGRWYSPATIVLPVTWQATLRPYKHQITHLGTFDIVISPANFFFCCENSSVKRGNPPPDLPYLPHDEGRPSKK